MSESENHFNATPPPAPFPFPRFLRHAGYPKREGVQEYRRVSHGSERFDPANSKWKL